MQVPGVRGGSAAPVVGRCEDEERDFGAHGHAYGTCDLVTARFWRWLSGMVLSC